MTRKRPLEEFGNPPRYLRHRIQRFSLRDAGGISSAAGYPESVIDNKGRVGLMLILSKAGFHSMLGLLFFFLLLIAGTFLAYRFSSASKVKKRMQGVLLPFEELDAELRRMRQSLQNETELSSSQYIQGVNAARLKAIPLDEL